MVHSANINSMHNINSMQRIATEHKEHSLYKKYSQNILRIEKKYLW